MFQATFVRHVLTDRSDRDRNRITALQPSDRGMIHELVRQSFSEVYGSLVRKSFEEHFETRAAGLDDGRHYFKYVHLGKTVGVAGYHVHRWDPPNTCTAGWFFVHPQSRSLFVVRALAKRVLLATVNAGIDRIVVETSSSLPAAALLKKLHIPVAGIIEAFYPDGGDKLIFDLRLPRNH